jgi:hypothetical protein
MCWKYSKSRKSHARCNSKPGAAIIIDAGPDTRGAPA